MNVTVLQAIYKYRTEMLGYTQTEASKEIGVTQAHYSNFERGKSNSTKILDWYFGQPDFIRFLYMEGYM